MAVVPDPLLCTGAYRKQIKKNVHILSLGEPEQQFNLMGECKILFLCFISTC